MVSLKQLALVLGGWPITSFFLSGWRKYFVLPLIGFTLWWIPWSPALHTGVLFYWPYEADGDERFLKVTGPLAARMGGEWTSSESIPKACKKALVAAEDALFYEHPGVDWDSTQKSVLLSVPALSSFWSPDTAKKSRKPKKQKEVRGGSTITQQIVKNAFLSRSRSYLRKSREIAGALLLDATVAKSTQLDWYFNIVEFGPKIYGIQNAAQFYFKKSAKDLTATQCAELVGILPSPVKWGKSLVKGTPSAFLAKRTSVILKRAQIIERFEASAKVKLKTKDTAISESLPIMNEELIKELDNLHIDLKSEAGSETEFNPSESEINPGEDDLTPSQFENPNDTKLDPEKLKEESDSSIN